MSGGGALQVASVVKNNFGRHLAPCLVGEFVNRTTSFVTSQIYVDRQANVADKVKRLRLLLFKIHSVIEAAEAAMPIGNLSLYRWLIELQDAAREGDDMIIVFKMRTAEDPLQTAGQRGFFLSSLWDVYQKAQRAVTDLFWHDYDADRLANSLDRLEKISSDVGSFLALLELDSRRRDKRGFGNAPKSNTSLTYGVLLGHPSEANLQDLEESSEKSKGAVRRAALQSSGRQNDHH